jgi:RNA polymerase sigma factor (sigma-70 family)
MENGAIHTVEHLFATFVRNSEFKDNIIYFGPMGCRTGFYFLTTKMSHEDALQLTKDALRFVADFEGEIAPEADEITVKLQKAILALPIKQRLVFNMRYYDELPFEAISQITGDSVSTLKTNYHYAAKRVKQIVSQLEYE